MKNKTLIGIYPGSFDPLTLGHLDIIRRSTRLVDKLIIAIGSNYEKKNTFFFSYKEREDLINECVKENLYENNTNISIEVKVFNGLLIDFAVEQKASIIIRGLRALSDFDFEFGLASGNQILNPNIESIFLMTSVNKQFISSRLSKEIFMLGGDVSKFLPLCVSQAMKAKKL